MRLLLGMFVFTFIRARLVLRGRMAGLGLMLLGGRGPVFLRRRRALLRASGFAVRGLRVIRLLTAGLGTRRLGVVYLRVSRRGVGRFRVAGLGAILLRAIFCRGAISLRAIGHLGPSWLRTVGLRSLRRNSFRPVGRGGILAGLFHRASSRRQVANVAWRDRPHIAIGGDGMLGDENRRAAVVHRCELGVVAACRLAKFYLRPHGSSAGRGRTWMPPEPPLKLTRLTMVVLLIMVRL